jgi:hypothetical protein
MPQNATKQPQNSHKTAPRPGTKKQKGKIPESTKKTRTKSVLGKETGTAKNMSQHTKSFI